VQPAISNQRTLRGANKMRLKRRATDFAVLLVAAAFVRRADGALDLRPRSTQSVVVSPPKCEDDSFPLVAFLDTLRVELAGTGQACCALAEPGDPSSVDAALRVGIEELGHCGSESERVRITVRKPAASMSIEREISLSDVAATARSRALALAVAEMIRLLGQDTHEEPPKPVPNVPQRPKILLPKPAPQTAVPIEFVLRAEADAHSFPTHDTLLWGGRARLTVYRHPFHADFDLGANYGDSHVALGELRVRSAGLGFGFGPRLVSSSLIVDLGPRVEVGWAWIRGATTMPGIGTDTGSAGVASLGFRASMEGPARAGLRPCVALEGGGVLRGMNADQNGQTVAGMGGYYLLAGVGLAVWL
jgi:hypothetical protein